MSEQDEVKRDEEYKALMETIGGEFLEILAKRSLCHEQCLHVLAYTVGNILGNIKHNKGDFEMRMSETRVVEWIANYAAMAQNCQKKNATKAFDKDGEVDINTL